MFFKFLLVLDLGEFLGFGFILVCFLADLSL